MQTHWPKLMAALCSIAILGFPLYATDVSKPLTPEQEKFWLRPQWKVKVTVSADESIKNSVSSYLNRELRSLGDVDIVDNNPEWQLSILGGELETAGGRKTGVVLSTVILTPFNSKILLSQQLKPEYKDKALQMTSQLFWYPEHWLRIGPADSLQTLCKEIIAAFDTKYLEEQRRSRRSFKELLEKPK